MGFANGAYSAVDPTVLMEFQAAQKAALGDAAAAMAGTTPITCSLNQAPVPAGSNCANGNTPGWCYVTGAGITGGSTCTQQISYSSQSLVPNGASISLQCISTSGGSDGGSAKADGG